MSTNVVNQVPYLRTTREFPEEMKELTVQINKSYVDIANAVNFRIIGIFPKNRPAITGESWYLTSQRNQTLRQIYSFGAIAAGAELDIPTGIPPTDIVRFTKIYANVITTTPDYRPIPYIDPAVLTTGMTILVGQVAGIQQIRIILGATAVPVTSGIAVLEWLSNV